MTDDQELTAIRLGRNLEPAARAILAHYVSQRGPVWDPLLEGKIVLVEASLAMYEKRIADREMMPFCLEERNIS